MAAHACAKEGVPTVEKLKELGMDDLIHIIPKITEEKKNGENS
jgi:hypothetical protein